MAKSLPPPSTAAGPAKAARRRPGRPLAADADAAGQRAALLQAALDCYVRHGISGATLRHIATHAGVTPATLHYHFGSRERLLDAVVEERLLPALAPMHAAVIAAGDDVADSVAALVNGLCAMIRDNPWLPSLWVREVVSEGGALRALLVERIAPTLAQALAGRFARAQAQGRMNRDLDPRLLMVSLIGLTMFPAAGAPIWRQVFGAADLDMDDVRRHALVLLDRGLELK
jgi:AcrR family transcriptional regulator